MLKMKGTREGRRSKKEICDEARRLYSVELVSGVSEFLESSVGGSIHPKDDLPGSFYIHQNGSDYVEWQTDLVPSATDAKDVVFVFWMGTGIGSALPQPTGQFDMYLNGGYLLSFRVVKENQTWRRQGCTFHYWVKNLLTAPPRMAVYVNEHIQEEATASLGLGFLKIPKAKLKEGRNVLKVCSNRRKLMGRWSVEPSKRWFGAETRETLFYDTYIDKGVAAVCSEEAPPQMGEYKVFFGDIHVHSGESKWIACGLGSIDDNYQYARDVANLDIFALADHDWQLPEAGEWELRLEKADEYNEEGRFVTLPSFEWTSTWYGHRNVYYLDSKWPLIESGPKYTTIPWHGSIEAGGFLTPADLWRELRRCGAKAITVPHHPNTSFFPLDWGYMDPEFDRLVEVYSNWGNSEYFGAPYSCPPDRFEGLSVQDALAQGHRLGIIASSDGHDGHPGNSGNGNHASLGSGLVAVLAPRLTREEVFRALYERRCYATTGTRILLDFKVNGKVMGSEITVPEKVSPRTIMARVEGTTDIAHIELVRNNVDILKKEIRGRTAEINLVDRENIGETCFYYLRVTQKDNAMAWSSPIWVTAPKG